MNIVIISGEITTKTEFKFIYDKFKIDGNKEKYKHVSIAKCKIKLENKNIVEIYGYDAIADIMYKNLKIDDRLVIIGTLDNEGKIEACELEIFCYNFS